MRRARSVLRPHTHCNWDRSGNWAAVAGRSSAGSRGRTNGTTGQADPARGHQHPRRVSPTRSHHTAVVDRRQEQPPYRRVEILRQLGTRRRPRRGQRSDDQRATGPESSDPVSHDVPQSPGHSVPDNGVAHSLADDEPDPDGAAGLSRPTVRAGHVTDHRVYHQTRTICPAASTDHQAEVLAACQASTRGKHGASPAITPTGARGPCDDGRRESPAPPWSACAAETRGSWRDGDCWAGKCACPCSRLSVSRSDLPSRSVVRLPETRHLFRESSATRLSSRRNHLMGAQTHPPQAGDLSRVRMWVPVAKLGYRSCATRAPFADPPATDGCLRRAASCGTAWRLLACGFLGWPDGEWESPCCAAEVR